MPAGSLNATYDHGSVVAIGNTSMTCEQIANQPTCPAAQRGEGVFLNRQLFPMRNVNVQTTPDIDGLVPFNSSSSKLDLGQSTVTSAYLIWGGDVRGQTGEVSPNPDARGKVRLKTPDGIIHDLAAGTVSNYGSTGDGRYTALADVSELVRNSGSGTYQVDNIQAASDIASFGGWSLVVMTHNDADPLRLLAVIAPNATFEPGTAYSATMALPATSGDRAVSVAVAAFEGDSGISPETFAVNSVAMSNAINPANDPFNSSVIGAVDNVFVNNFGTDVDRYDTKVSGPALTIAATSSRDLVRLGLIAVAVDL
jgi:hypothetical protein